MLSNDFCFSGNIFPILFFLLYSFFFSSIGILTCSEKKTRTGHF